MLRSRIRDRRAGGLGDRVLAAAALATAAVIAGEVGTGAGVVIGNQSAGYHTKTPGNPSCAMGATLKESPQQTLTTPTVHVDTLTASGSMTCSGVDFVELVITQDGTQCSDTFAGAPTIATYSTSGRCQESNPATGKQHTADFLFILARQSSVSADGPCQPERLNNEFLDCTFHLETFVDPKL
jgi:hypothetical protein